MYAEQDDGSLVRAAREGDMGAFALLLIRHRPVLLALCRRTLGDPVLAEDAAQEASLLALLQIDRLQRAERFGSWLAGIGLNVCRMWLRARSRECWSWEALSKRIEHNKDGEVVEIGATSNVLLHLVADSDVFGDPAAQARDADLSTSVREAVAVLPCGQRIAVQLFYLSGFSYKETAALLGIEEGTLRTRLHKARESLRVRLRLLGEEEHLMRVDRQPQEERIMEGKQEHEYTCSFCGKQNEEVHRMIAGPPPVSAAICDACIGLCNQIIADAEAKAATQ